MRDVAWIVFGGLVVVGMVALVLRLLTVVVIGDPPPDLP